MQFALCQYINNSENYHNYNDILRSNVKII